MTTASDGPGLMGEGSKQAEPFSGPPLVGWPLITVRILAMALLLLACAPLYYLVALFTRRNPIPRLFLRGLTLIAGVKVRTTGAHPAPRSFYLANHVSWIDIPALAGMTGCTFVAHDGLAAIGPLRWLCSLNDTVFIARHVRSSVAAQVEQVRTALLETGALAIFPEGTTSDGTDLLPFKSALLSAIDADMEHVPVQPVWLDYGSAPASLAWVGAEPGLSNALRILSRWRPVRLTIHFLPALKEQERSDRKAIARAAREAIARQIAARAPQGAR